MLISSINFLCEGGKKVEEVAGLSQDVSEQEALSCLYLTDSWAIFILTERDTSEQCVRVCVNQADILLWCRQKQALLQLFVDRQTSLLTSTRLIRCSRNSWASCCLLEENSGCPLLTRAFSMRGDTPFCWFWEEVEHADVTLPYCAWPVLNL